jgi:hypothetical protein
MSSPTNKLDLAAAVIFSATAKQVADTGKTVAILIRKVAGDNEKLVAMQQSAEKAIEDFMHTAEEKKHSKADMLLACLTIAKVQLELLSEEMLKAAEKQQEPKANA